MAKRCSRLIGVILLVAVSSCSHQTTTSQDGRQRCLEEANAKVISAEEKERRAFFRQCLQSIDLKIAAEARKLRDNAEATQSDAIIEQASTIQMSNLDRYLYCKMNQDRIIELYKKAVDLKAKLINASKPGSPFSGQENAFSQELNATRNQLESALPMKVRGEWTSIDLAVSKFRSCSRSDFQLSP